MNVSAVVSASTDVPRHLNSVQRRLYDTTDCCTMEASGKHTGLSQDFIVSTYFSEEKSFPLLIPGLGSGCDSSVQVKPGSDGAVVRLKLMKHIDAD